jgi:putative addiction module component (TIGR02574 family)
MTSSAPKPAEEQLLEQALQLPKAQRLRLVDRLWQSIEGEDAQEPLELDPELHAELLRRLKSIGDGTAVVHDGVEAMRDLRGKLDAQ